MATYVFLKGIILGFSIAAPVGPIGILCIRRTIAGGMAVGFFSGLGTATADALYGLVAALGLTAVAAFLVDHQVYLRLSGGFFLCYLGWTALRAVPVVPAAGAVRESLWGAYLSAFLLTLANPMTILSFAAVFAGVGVGDTGGWDGATLMVLGVFSGSLLWWLLLSGGVSLLRARFDHGSLKWINRLSGAAILGFGLICLFSLA